ncbi:hypothetical protein PP175_05490 [Aneurinibacillus sp. Ricciae_BoGa-3]|uniref:hypothetical protein n=1 Tax=Aneurinibacillus sp. Ricciae_BoGa-3 TaxID=3022697 RepID=UPI00233F91B0|nr:hypothetical protein [Aneurinibacillus sp. Ricciae_BoGa-3]WCK55405.1 hypothetical protein PP175_05490 [Aneurinibacillus sp. Ricciae_BoGa-3]
MKFSVLIPEKPSGSSIMACFGSLGSQMVKAGMLQKPVKRLRVNPETKSIEIEVEDKMNE